MNNEDYPPSVDPPSIVDLLAATEGNVVEFEAPRLSQPRARPVTFRPVGADAPAL